MIQELLAIKMDEAPIIRNYVHDLKELCKYNDLNLDASESKYTIWKDFGQRKRWVAPFDNAEEAVKWLEMMKRQHTVKGEKLPWSTPNWG